MKCRKCGGEMKLGKALAKTVTAGSKDFPSDDRAVTFSFGGPGEMVDCMKCQDCGHSVQV